MEKQNEEGKQKELDREASQNEQIRETGQAVLDGNSRKHKVELLTVIGEIEGHESAPSHSKTTKYEHVLPKLAEADAFVIGCPVYFASPAGGAISFMDRLFFSTLGIDKTMKVGAAVVTCRRGGNTATFDVLNKYFTMTGMPVASSQYWNMVYGGSAEEVAQDAEGLQTMRTLGRNMAFMMKSFQLGKEQIGLPQKEPLIFTNFHR